MRVLLCTPYPDERSGAKATNAVAPYSKPLAEHLHPLVELTICADGARRESVLRDGARIERMPLTGLRGLWNMLRCAWATRPDVVHVQHEMYLYGGVETILAFPWIVALMHCVAPVVVTLHHTVSQDSIRKEFRERHMIRIPLFLVRLGIRAFYETLRLARCEVVVHHAVFADILIREYGFPRRRVHVIPHGHADVGERGPVASGAELRSEFRIPADATTVFGFFGYLDPRKNIEFMLEEFRVFSRMHPTCVLVIAGDVHPRHADKPEYRAYLRRLHELARSCQTNVLWHGYIADGQIPRFLQAIDCLILPYDSVPGMSSVLSLAIGAERPFLASESLAAVAGDECLTFARTEGALVKALGEFVTRNLFVESHMQTHLERLKETASWARCANLTARLYRHVDADRNGRKRVLVVGAYGQGNLGDELLLRQCLDTLGRERCTVVSSDPSHTMLQHDARSIDRTEYVRLARELFRSSAIVVGGGDQFKLLKRSQRRRPHSLLLQGWLLTHASRILGTPFYFLGVGIGNVSTRLAAWLTRSTLSCATAVTFREQGSAAWCAEHAPRANGRRTADLCFLSTPPARPGERARILGIAPTFHLDRPAAYDAMVDATARAADEYLEESVTHSVVLLPFQQTHDDPHDDRRVCRAIARTMRAKERASVVGLSVNTCHEAIGSLHTLWAVRLHSLILACLHGVPFIALIYDEKIRKFLKEIGCEQWGIELTDDLSGDTLMALHRHLLAEHDAVRRHLLGQAELLRERCAPNVELFDRIRALP